MLSRSERHMPKPRSIIRQQLRAADEHFMNTDLFLDFSLR